MCYLAEVCDPSCVVQHVCVWQPSVLYSDVEAKIRLDVDDGVSHGGQLQRHTGHMLCHNIVGTPSPAAHLSDITSEVGGFTED